MDADHALILADWLEERGDPATLPGPTTFAQMLREGDLPAKIENGYLVIGTTSPFSGIGVRYVLPLPPDAPV